MGASAYFQVNPEIVCETIEGEVVAIDLKTGCYYSMVATAADVWSLLQCPASMTDIVDVLAVRYDADQETVASALTNFLERLQAENLIVRSADTAADPGRDAELPPAAAGSGFAVPELQKFADMQDLLKIDPIHEVGEAGWPLKAPPSSQT